MYTNDENLIKITHYINPHMFWFKYESSFFNDVKFSEFCDTIQTYYSEEDKTGQHPYKPQVGEVVGVFNFSWNCWLRAEVECVPEISSRGSQKYVVWAIDYGIPLRIEARFIRKLPKTLAVSEIQFKLVHFGGLADIVPANKVYDSVTCSTTISKCAKWSPYSIKVIDDLIKAGAYVRFFKKKFNSNNEQLFGDLEIVTYTNHIIKPKIILLESQHAIGVNDDFFEILNNIGTNTVSRCLTHSATQASIHRRELENQINEQLHSDQKSFLEECNKVDGGENDIKTDHSLSSEANLSNELNSKDSNDTINFKSRNKLSLTQQVITANKKLAENRIPAGVDLRNYQPKKASVADNIVKSKSNLYSGKSHSNNTKESQLNTAVGNMKQVISGDPKMENKNGNEIDANMGQFEDKNHAITGVYMNMNNNQHRQNENSKKSTNNLEICAIEKKLTKHLLLVHGRRTQPIEKLQNAHFCEDVHRELENMGFTQIHQIQSYVWPHIMRGNSAVVINSARTGKTMSYLPAICSLIKMKKDEGTISKSRSPITVIVVRNSLAVEKLSRICRKLFEHATEKLSVIQCYGLKQMETTGLLLSNGCDILIATAPSLVRLIFKNIKIFDLNRLQHLVVDDIDWSQAKVQCDLDIILKTFCVSNKNGPLQIILTAEMWDSSMFEVLKICKNPQLCIGAYLEAAVYAGVQFQIKFTGSESKVRAILNFIKNHPCTREQLIIVCNNKADLEEVVSLLANTPYMITYARDNATAAENQQVFEQHRGDPATIFACTDHVLNQSISLNVQNLIHYSMPDSWSTFAFRHSVLFNYYEDLLKNKEAKKPPAKTLVLVDETNNSQLPKLIDFLKSRRCNENITHEILKLGTEILDLKEELRIMGNRELCSTLMSYGECPNLNDCEYRHILTTSDRAYDGIPTEGIIIAEVLNIISPAHYCVRILEQQTENGIVIPQFQHSANYLELFLELALYFNDSNNHIIHWPIRINDICAVKYGDKYHRAKILEVHSKSKSKESFSVVVKLVDTGQIIWYKSSALLNLPDRFKDTPFQAVNLRVYGLVPYDYERNWVTKAKFSVKYWLELCGTESDSRPVLKFTILFSIMDTIWVDKIVMQKNMKSMSEGIDIIEELMNRNFATSLFFPMNFIKVMANKCGILPTKEKIIAENLNDFNRLDEKTWNTIAQNVSVLEESSSIKSAHMNQFDIPSEYDEDNNKNLQKLTTQLSMTNNIAEKWETLKENDFNHIIVTEFCSPSHFYVLNVPHLKRLNKLYKMIKNHIESNASSNVIDPKINLNCLAQFKDNFNRAKITEVTCTSGKTEVNLFFCDVGASMKTSLEYVYHTNEEIVTFMPFQAIHCKLVGIQHNSNDIWIKEVCDLIYDDVIEPCDLLYVKPIMTEEPKLKNNLRYWKYEVVMIGRNTNVRININKKLVEEGMTENCGLEPCPK